MPPPRRCLWFASVSVPSPAPPRHLATPARPGCPPGARGRKVQGEDAVQPPRTWGRTPAARRAVRRRGPTQPRAPGLSLLTPRKRGPYMGGLCPVTRPRSPGRFRESPPPLCPARAAAPGRRPGFSQAGGCLGPESPRPGSRASVVGGPRSRVQGAAPEPPAPGWRPGPAAPTLSDLTRVGVCCCPRAFAAAVPLTSARKGGARLPVSPPGARPASGRLPSLVLPGWLARPPRASVALARGAFPRSCDWSVGS